MTDIDVGNPRVASYLLGVLCRSQKRDGRQVVVHIVPYCAYFAVVCHSVHVPYCVCAK
jgi:hypothetical protein